jgi:hypothetical protein
MVTMTTEAYAIFNFLKRLICRQGVNSCVGLMVSIVFIVNSYELLKLLVLQISASHGGDNIKI